jgi:hypothetical protein
MKSIKKIGRYTQKIGIGRSELRPPLDRTNRTELIEQDCHYRAAKKDSPGKTKGEDSRKDCQNRIAG